MKMSSISSWYNVMIDFSYFAFLWWMIPAYPTVLIGILSFFLFTQLWLITSNDVPMEMKYNMLKDRYITFWFLGGCFMLRWITFIPFFFYSEYVMAALQALVMGTYWWLYQNIIRAGKRMGLR